MRGFTSAASIKSFSATLFRWIYIKIVYNERLNNNRAWLINILKF